MANSMISVVLATHNEEANLSRCLQSVKNFADEIIIVDGESIDQTVQIGQNFGAKIIKTTNKENFHINKQIAMDQAHGQLVLQLDADEVVDEVLAKNIVKIAKQLENLDHTQVQVFQPKAWNLKRKNYFLGRFLTKGGQYPDPVIRLYINGFAKLPQKDVHEQMWVDGEIETLSGHLLHYSNPTFSEYLRKFNTYTSFKANQLKAEKIPLNAISTTEYLLWKPAKTFFSLFLRHRGYKDKVAGFVFALMSGLYWSISYLKLWELHERKD